MMTFQEFKSQKIDEIVSLFLSVYQKEPWYDKWPSFERAKEYLLDIVKTPGFKGYIALYDKDIIGVCVGCINRWWQGDEFFIKEFFIDDKLQGNGIGSKLYDYTVLNLKNNNVKNIILLTNKNVKAYDFYKKRGLKKSQDTVFMYQNIT